MGFMEKDGTHTVAGVMVGGGKWCFRCGMVLFDYSFIFLVEVLDGLCAWVKM